LKGPLRALRELGVSFAASDVLVLCYHDVRRRERFHDQISILLSRGYSVLTMEEFIAWVRRRQPIRSPAVLLTFDGGYRSQLDNALPALEAFKLPATFFPLSSGLDLDDAEVSARELAALAAGGHTIGCHTHTHPDLTTLLPDDLEREVAGSKRILEDVVGRPVTAFCYPDGLRSSQVAAAVQRAGFEVAFAVDLGGVNAGDDPYQLRRIPILGEPGPREFGAFLKGTRGVSGGILIGWKLRERLLTASEPASAMAP
jgi:peptidoglycan/xylan/chitin deacetylase (PgdA/CDA1 family)